MVVAGPDLVEDRGVHLDAERLTSGARHPGRHLEATTAQLEVDHRLVGQELVLDDISGDLATHGDDLVAGVEAGPGSR